MGQRSWFATFVCLWRVLQWHEQTFGGCRCTNWEKRADEVYRVVQDWAPFDRSTVGLQIARVADSVGAHIAEGVGRGTYKDNCRLVTVARGSLNETVHWLRRACTRSLLKKEQIERLKALTDELGPRLNAYLKSIRKRSEGRE